MLGEGSFRSSAEEVRRDRGQGQRYCGQENASDAPEGVPGRQY